MSSNTLDRQTYQEPLNFNRGDYCAFHATVDFNQGDRCTFHAPVHYNRGDYCTFNSTVGENVGDRCRLNGAYGKSSGDHCVIKGRKDHQLYVTSQQVLQQPTVQPQQPTVQPQQPTVQPQQQAPISEDLLCVICLEHQKAFMFVECGHLCLCHQCKTTMEGVQLNCPICRTPSARLQQVFFLKK